MSRRLTYLREQHGHALLTAFRTERRNEPFLDWIAAMEDEAAADAVFARYRAADPTAGGACAQWLIRLALGGSLPAEDLPKARETLEAFLAYKRRLPAEQRDLGRFDSLGDVWACVGHLAAADMPTSGKDEERREREVVMADSEIVIAPDDPAFAGWTVAIPTTERAAKWWGRGTRWCTAAEKNNMFAPYAASGPLVVFIRPDGEKFQFHAQSGQFMNAADDPVVRRDALSDLLQRLVQNAFPEKGKGPTERHIHLEALLMTIFPLGMDKKQPDGSVLWHADDLWDGAAQLAISKYALPLAEVPDDHIDKKAALAAVRWDGHNIEYVPREMLDDEICRVAIEQDGEAVMHLRHTRFLTYDLCLAAVRQTGHALMKIPGEFVDEAICLAAVRNTPFALYFVPEGMHTREMCFSAVEKNGGMLKDVPPRLRSREMCHAAVETCGRAIHAVPDHLKDQTLCRLAFRDREVCLEALRIDQGLMTFVPPNLRTEVREALVAEGIHIRVPRLWDDFEEAAAGPIMR